MEEVMDIKYIKDVFGMSGTFQEDMLNLFVFIFTKQIRKDFPKPYKKMDITENGVEYVSRDKYREVFVKTCHGTSLLCYVCVFVFQCIKKNFLKKTINILKF